MGSRTTTEQKMPEFQEKFLKETVIPYATDIAEREFTPFEGERVAGMTGLQQQAMGGYGSLGMGEPLYGQAADIYGRLGSFEAPDAQAARIGQVGSIAEADMARYMSPYAESVIESGLRDLGGAQQVALGQQQARAQKAGAFGGSRHGIAEAETRKAYGQQAADLIARERANAFRQAQQAAQFDITGQQQRALSQAGFEQQANLANQQAAIQSAGVRARAAAGLGATAGQQLQSQLAGLGAQMQAGEAGRGLNQAALDAMYAEFARQQDFPLTGLNALATAASGIPSGYGTTTQSYGGLGPALGAVGSFGMGMGYMGYKPFQ